MYVVYWTDALGKRRSKQAGSSRARAEALLDELIQQRRREQSGLVDEGSADAPLRGLADAYAVHMESLERSAEHMARALGCLDRLVEALVERGADTVDKVRLSMISDMRAARAREVSARTVNKEFGVLRAMLRWAASEQRIPFNRLSDMAPLRVQDKRVRRPLREDEVRALLAVSREDDARLDSRGRRIPQSALWLVLLGTGARWSEATSMRWSDLDVSARTITLRAAYAKNRRRVVMPVSESLVVELEALRHSQAAALGRVPSESDRILLTPTGAVWTPHRRNALRRLRSQLTKAGIPLLDDEGRRVDLHALRNTFGTRLARNGASTAKTQKLMRHSDPVLTMRIYVDLGDADLASEVDSLPPLEGNAAPKQHPAPEQAAPKGQTKSA